MSEPVDAVEEAIDIVLEFGCPICGEPAHSALVRSFRTIALSPCEHAVTPEDATHMKEFYRELWFAQIHGTVS